MAVHRALRAAGLKHRGRCLGSAVRSSFDRQSFEVVREANRRKALLGAKNRRRQSPREKRCYCLGG